MLGQDAGFLQSSLAGGCRLAGPLVWTFLRGLRSWQFFVLAVGALAVDLIVQDPLPFVDEILLGMVTLLLARLKRQPDMRP